jgi:hypothetical protein
VNGKIMLLLNLERGGVLYIMGSDKNESDLSPKAL